MEGLSAEKREGRGSEGERERKESSSATRREEKYRASKVGRLTTEVEGFERILEERDGSVGG